MKLYYAVFSFSWAPSLFVFMLNIVRYVFWTLNIFYLLLWRNTSFLSFRWIRSCYFRKEIILILIFVFFQFLKIRNLFLKIDMLRKSFFADLFNLTLFFFSFKFIHIIIESLTESLVIGIFQWYKFLLLFNLSLQSIFILVHYKIDEILFAAFLPQILLTFLFAACKTKWVLGIDIINREQTRLFKGIFCALNIQRTL